MSGHWFPKRTIGSLIDERLARDGTRLAFEHRRWMFAELAWDVDAVARGLVASGIAPGDKVSLWMMNRPEWICAALAVMRIGAVPFIIYTSGTISRLARPARYSFVATPSCKAITASPQ